MADDEDHDHSQGLANWLQDAGRRGGARVPENVAESSDDVLAYLESLTGQKLRSRSAVDRLLREFAVDEANRVRHAKVRAARQHVLLLALAALSFLHYYYWDVNLQIAALPEMKVFVPVHDRDRGVKGHVQRTLSAREYSRCKQRVPA